MDPRDWRGTWEEWFALAGACKAAGIARDDFVEWSMGDEEYADRRDEIERIWEAAWGEHPGALYAALAARNIRLPSQRLPSQPPHLIVSGSPKTGSNLFGPETGGKLPGKGHHLDRIKGLRASLCRDQREKSAFWHARLYGEILYEQGTTSARAFEVAQTLLEGECPELIKAIGIAAVRRSIQRGFHKARVKFEGGRNEPQTS
jgi:hypothetical protein